MSAGSNPFIDEAPPEKAEKPKLEGERIHVTGVDRWLECGFRDDQYRKREWLEPFTPAKIRGHAVHAAREMALKHFRKHGALPSVEDCRGRADATVREETKSAEDLGDAAIQAEADAIAADARTYAEADRQGVLPSLAPHEIEVEETIEVQIAGEGLRGVYVLSGRPDAIARSPVDGRLAVPDLKTSSIAPSAASVNASTQHSLYSALVQSKFGEVAAHSIDHIRTLKTSPRSPLKPNQKLIPLSSGSAVLTRIPTDRTADDIAAALRRLRFVLDAREQGFAPPAAASFMSPCHRCPHRGAADKSQRCPWVPASKAGEGNESDE